VAVDRDGKAPARARPTESETAARRVPRSADGAALPVGCRHRPRPPYGESLSDSDWDRPCARPGMGALRTPRSRMLVPRPAIGIHAGDPAGQLVTDDQKTLAGTDRLTAVAQARGRDPAARLSAKKLQGPSRRGWVQKRSDNRHIGGFNGLARPASEQGILSRISGRFASFQGRYGLYPRPNSPPFTLCYQAPLTSSQRAGRARLHQPILEPR